MAQADLSFLAGETYRIVWNEHTYEGFTFGYKHYRDTRLLNNTGQVADLITEDGLALLTKERTTTTGYPFTFPPEDLASASANVVDNITLIDSSSVENDDSDEQQNRWSSKDTLQKTYDFKIKDDATPGRYYLLWSKQRYNPDYDQDYVSPDNITIGFSSSVSLSIDVTAVPPLVPPRPIEYDEDAVWDPIEGEWVDPNALTSLGGGRYSNILVAVNNKGNVYFGAR